MLIAGIPFFAAGTLAGWEGVPPDCGPFVQRKSPAALASRAEGLSATCCASLVGQRPLQWRLTDGSRSSGTATEVRVGIIYRPAEFAGEFLGNE